MLPNGLLPRQPQFPPTNPVHALLDTTIYKFTTTYHLIVTRLWERNGVDRVKVPC
jgi:hypothetical protein